MLWTSDADVVLVVCCNHDIMNVKVPLDSVEFLLAVLITAPPKRLETSLKNMLRFYGHVAAKSNLRLKSSKLEVNQCWSQVHEKGR